MTNPDARLKCFLHYGTEKRVYKASFPSKIMYTPEKAFSIIEILSDDARAEGIINTITKVFHTEYSIDPRICLFALAMVIRKAKGAKKLVEERHKELEDVKKKNEQNQQTKKEAEQKKKEFEERNRETAGCSRRSRSNRVPASRPTTTSTSQPENNLQNAESEFSEMMDTSADEKNEAGKEAEQARNLSRIGGDNLSKYKSLSNEERKIKFACKQDLLISRAYSAARKLCNTDPSGTLFLTFSGYLRSIAETDKVKGFGKGWRKTIDKWYSSVDSRALAEKVASITAPSSWRHQDILCLRNSISQFPDDIVTVLSFVKFGIEGAQSANEKAAKGKLAAESQKALDFLTSVFKVRRTNNIEDVINAIKTQGLILDHILPKFHSESTIWPLLIPSMSIDQILSLTVRMSKLGIFKDKEVASAYKARLETFSDKDTTIDPIKVFVVRKNYLDGPKLALDFQLRQQQRQQAEAANNDNMQELPSPMLRQPQPPPRRHAEVEQTLSGLFEKTLANLAQTGLKYLIAVDRLAASPVKHCFPERFVTTEEAILLVIMCVMKPEKKENVKMVTFVETDTYKFKDIELNKDTDSMETLKLKIHTAEEARNANVAHLLQHLTIRKESVDVVIILSDNNMTGCGAQSALETYHNEVNKFAKVISFCVNGAYKKSKELSKENMLLLAGFDSNIGRLIRAYSRGAF